MLWLSFHTPLGSLTLFQDNDHLVALDWGWVEGEGDSCLLLQEAKSQMSAYFSGHLTRFDVPLAPQGTAFQNRVWQALSQIPYGQTRSYGDLAQDLGSSPRAIGQACGRNPLPILIPCHRVLASRGGLGGYSGGNGPSDKSFLLRLEGVCV